MWEDTFSALGEHNHEQDGKLKGEDGQDRVMKD